MVCVVQIYSASAVVVGRGSGSSLHRSANSLPHNTYTPVRKCAVLHTLAWYTAYYMQRARKRIRYVGMPRARSGLKEGGPRRQVRANHKAPCAIFLDLPSPLSLSSLSSLRFQSLFTFAVSLSRYLRNLYLSLFRISIALSPSSASSSFLRSVSSSFLATVNLFKRVSRPRHYEYRIFLVFGTDCDSVPWWLATQLYKLKTERRATTVADSSVGGSYRPTSFARQSRPCTSHETLAGKGIPLIRATHDP